MSTAPTFDHRDAGRLEAEWMASPGWSRAEPLDLVDSQGRPVTRLVVAVAHPDDETLACAGLLAEADRRGIPTVLVMATAGEGSHPDSPTHTPEDLRSIRRRELTDALAVLSPTARLAWLDLPDGAVRDHSAPLREVLAGQVDATTLLVSTWHGDGHTDHEAVAEAARTVAAATGARHLQAPIWLWHWGSDADVPWERARLWRLDEHHREAKARALAAYASQHGALSPAPGDEAVLGPGLLEHFDRDVETYLEDPAVEPAGPVAAASVFDELHRDGRDPWELDTAWYERRKRALALAALPAPRYGQALEVGCSVGSLTAELATRAESVLALDVSAEALARAGQRLETAAGVELRKARVPEEWPAGVFDLVVLSEVGYFLTRDQLDEVLARTEAALPADGTLLLVHWRHPVVGWALDGPQVHAAALARSGWRVATRVEDDDFEVLVLLRRTPEDR